MEKKKRNRVKHQLSFDERLAREAERLRAEARHPSATPDRDAMLRKARQMDEARRMSELLVVREPR
ncbi:hypothetical protein JQ604_01970 [Bradyrhizobium jicamae]|uniref:hypothetical protein n=1 Tax=Bradyrhizobium jicamae TaxID=280332 RepID=UPI001BA63A41|nr:hypothetical protein [Bradyrhizobium jicamae]MBR0750933.1 hypothetical protein [Bradyrhizobium jicamae]